ncbi:Tim44/TimA family putative adaptor protein [Methylovirgula sp. 4M-Z18]|uniref:Tim44/TimA family putative adaptor protein n=1 Tax=Methylovirgula sp. 4M-Z18 TaxID=2293567 RepID=UPI000E2E7E6F|nr:Tim44/TimA family putative adaptor protein [Methylovirgula sp. 4M-Z18]RFB78052.1 calcium-binding protein [Methylovirgula sp. 4M-Z18]
MTGSYDISTLILAVAAALVVWWLYTVLGTRNGHERPPFDPFQNPSPKEDTRPGFGQNTNALRMPVPANDATPVKPITDPDRWKGVIAEGSSADKGLDAILVADPAFSGSSFLSGARSAYEIILTAFAAGDTKTLKPLLAPDVYASFAQVIGERRERGERVETTFVSMDQACIESADVRGRMAHIVVRFVSKLISATYDKAGAVVAGEAGKVADVTDVWTFERDIGSRNPNWLLVTTHSDA